MTLVLGVYLLTLIAAEQFRLRVRRSLETAPTAFATGIGLALTLDLPGGPAGLSTPGVLGTVLLAQVVDWALVRRTVPPRRRGLLLVDGALRAAAVLLVSVAVRDLPLAAGRPLAVVLPGWPGWGQALVLGGIVAVVLTVDMPARAWCRSRVDRTRAASAVADELRASIGLQLAMAASGVVIGLGQQVLGQLGEQAGLLHVGHLERVDVVGRDPAGVVRRFGSELHPVAVDRGGHSRDGDGLLGGGDVFRLAPPRTLLDGALEERTLRAPLAHHDELGDVEADEETADEIVLPHRVLAQLGHLPEDSPGAAVATTRARHDRQ